MMLLAVSELEWEWRKIELKTMSMRTRNGKRKQHKNTFEEKCEKERAYKL